MTSTSLGRLLPALFSLAGAAHAQVTVEWEHLHAASAIPNCAIDACLPRAGGGYLAAGAEYQNFVDLPGPNYVSTGVFVMRLDADGALAWTRTFPAPNHSSIQPVVLAQNSAGEAFVGSRHGANASLRKLDADGNLVWTTNVAGNIWFIRGGLGTTPTGELVAVARTAGGSSSITVASFDPGGAPLTSITLVTTSFAPFLAAIDVTGRAAVVTSSHVYVVRPDGTLAWSGPHDLQVRALAFGASGELAVAGKYGKNAATVRLYDATGAELWNNWYPPSGQVAWWDAVAIDRFGAVAVAGHAYGLGGTDSTNANVALYTPDGNLAWVRTWVGPSGFEDAFETVLVAASGDVHAAGRTFLTSHDPYWTTAWRHLTTWWSRTGDLRAVHVGDGQDDSTALVESPSGAVVSAGGRFQQNFVNSGYTPLGAHVLALRPQSRAFCFGDGLDGACPCGNTSAPGAQEGCANSTGRGARLSDAGVASLSNDTLTLTVEGTTQTAPGLCFSGSPVIAPAVLGDGLQCAGGTQRRLFSRSAVGGTSTVPGAGDPSISVRAAASGDVLTPGSTRVYQVYHRDLNATFCPPPQGANSNVSSALAITWSS